MLADLSPLEATTFAVVLAGLIPVIIQCRDETELFTVSYVLLIIGMAATNLEVFFLGSVLSFVEHVFSIGLVRATFFVAAYPHRKGVINGGGISR